MRADTKVAGGGGWPMPVEPGIGARLSYALHHLLAANFLYRGLGGAVERRPRLYRWFTRVERAGKERLYGCRMCGQCALPATGYTCPMNCPKQLRNGPCGGVAADGMCEVYPRLKCVWVTAFERAEAAGHGGDMDLLQRPVDHREWGRSSWVNYWRGRDDELWTGAGDGRARPALHPRTEPGVR
ncbi:methylenetetrahydrofolate reductase C-terminal domain-containing protein [Sphaerisporangium aureirubrum]|uniref:Methylenetetrahydrofolate reductase C-terminal domain-containing protein n=1 Tax=Sphaerisporangium aureirubrum TaxID=1544736 RepID=A0ABW1NPD4_9ACTN